MAGARNGTFLTVVSEGVKSFVGFNESGRLKWNFKGLFLGNGLFFHMCL